MFSGLFKKKHKTFEYNPRYYDPTKDELHKRVKAAKQSMQGDTEGMKARISMGLHRAGLQDRKFRKKSILRSNLVVMGIAILLLVLVVLFLRYYFPKIVYVIG